MDTRRQLLSEDTMKSTVVNSWTQTEKVRYLELCQKFNTSKISLFIQNLDSSEISLAHRGVGSKAIRPITMILGENFTVQKVNFKDNRLDDQGATWIAQMFTRNLYIYSLTLSSNNLTYAGLKTLLQALEGNRTVTFIDLSDNGFGDKCGELLKDFLLYNETVQEFLFNNNKLCMSSGSHLREGIEYNSAVQHLDLSWNNLRCEGAEDISKSLIKNGVLKKINLSWNGFDDRCCDHFSKAFLVNDTLEEVDLSRNRISDQGASELSKGLLSNHTLRILRLGWNLIKSNGINDIVKALLQNKKSAIRKLHFQETFIGAQNKYNMNNLMTQIPDIEIIIGGFNSDGLENFDESAMRKELLHILKKYLIKHRLRMLDLFNQWDKDKSSSITRKEFRNGVRSCKIPFSETQMKYLVNWLDNDGSDEIDYQEFVRITEIE